MRYKAADPMTERITNTLLELLAIDSDNRAEKSEIIRYATDRLRGFGMKVEEVGDIGTPAIIATYGTGGIAFSGHLDTVPTGDGWSRKQGEIIKGRVYGRGAADMKGAVASMAHAAETLIEEDVPCSIMLTTDEEERMLGALALSRLDEVKKAAAIIIPEPTALNVAFKEKGVFRFRLITSGLAAHSSQSWLGENAITKMQSLLGRFTDLAQTPKGPTEDLTMCFATIRGGTKNNVVPDRCETEIDVRFPAPQTPGDIDELLRKRLGNGGYDIEIIYGLDAFQSNPRSWIVREIRSLLGTDIISVPYATEAPRYVKVNPRIFICGPGEPRMAHVVDEYVEINKLELTYRMLVHLARRAAQG